MSDWRRSRDELGQPTIYGLVDPRRGVIRYVGVSRMRLDRRRAFHLKAARRGYQNPVCRWIRTIAENFDIVPLRVVQAGEDPLAVEREYIASTGADLNVQKKPKARRA